MGYHATVTGTVRLDPSIDGETAAWIRDLAFSTSDEVRVGLPGSSSPWEVTAEGHLHIPSDCDRPRHIAEWLAVIITAFDDADLLGYIDPSAEVSPRTATGTLQVQGGCTLDRWELRVRDGRVTVHRSTLPCLGCWLAVQASVAPSVAYAFAHSDAAGLTHAGLREALVTVDETEQCTSTGVPRPRWQTVHWPPRFGPWWAEHVTGLFDRGFAAR